MLYRTGSGIGDEDVGDEDGAKKERERGMGGGGCRFRGGVLRRLEMLCEKAGER